MAFRRHIRFENVNGLLKNIPPIWNSLKWRTSDSSCVIYYTHPKKVVTSVEKAHCAWFENVRAVLSTKRQNIMLWHHNTHFVTLTKDWLAEDNPAYELVLGQCSLIWSTINLLFRIWDFCFIYIYFNTYYFGWSIFSGH